MKGKLLLAAFAAALVAGVAASMALAEVTAPPLPVTIAAGATFSNVTLNGTSTNLAVVAPGSANTITSTLTIAPHSGGTYFTAPVGFAYAASPFPGCPEGGYGDTDTVTQNFTAPGIAGVYDIVVDIGPNFTCQDSWHANAGQGTIARIVVTSVTALSPVHAWVGLKNSDDQGTQFDLQAELLDGSDVVWTGVERCIKGVTRNPSLAKEAIVNWDSFPAAGVQSGDVLGLRLSTRIGTNPDGTKCAGHSNAVGLRLYYDATSRASGFDMTLAAASVDQYLHSNGNACVNAESTGVTNRWFDLTAPTATAAKCKDSSSINFAGGNPWKLIGTWTMAAP